MSRLDWEYPYLISYHVAIDANRGRFSWTQTMLNRPIQFADVMQFRAEVARENGVPDDHVAVIAVSRLGI